MQTLTLSRALRMTACLFLLLGLSFNLFAAGYNTSGGKIYDATGQEVVVRGVNHHGFNSPILQPQFLWAMGWKEQLAQIKSLGFNAVRVPYVPDTLYNTTPVDKLSYIDPGRNPEFIGKTPLQALDLWMAEANRLGLYILLDFHSVSMQRQYPTWFVTEPADFGLMYNKQAYSPSDWQRDLVFVARRYANLKYFFGIDIYNEPNGKVRWSSGDAGMTDSNYFWKNAAESASAAILAANPNLLIFVQGTIGNFDGAENSSLAMNWGENFQPQKYKPLNIPADKLVLSPHTYGPDVYMKSSFSATNFPSNLSADWETLFGQFSSVNAVVPGEWGGHYGNGAGGTQDITWQNAFVDYLIKKGARNTFYWCYTPNSGDTGGVLDDNLNVREDKMAMLRKLWGSTATPSAKRPGAPAMIAINTTTGSSTPPPPTVTAPDPTISSFMPVSGARGSVVTIYGAGFTGINKAWVGDGHDASVEVVSDTQVRVTIPSDATSGAIGIFNSAHAAFTPTSFTVN